MEPDTWRVVLIANPGEDLEALDDLEDVEEEALFVGWAARFCGLCPPDQEPEKLFNCTGAEIERRLKQVLSETPDDGQIFIWYGGHGFGRRALGMKEEQGTLIVPKAEELGEGVRRVEGIWLENLIMSLVEDSGRRGIKVWCNLVSCRVKLKAEVELVGKDCDLVVPTYKPVVPSEGNDYLFLYTCEVEDGMRDSRVFAHSFYYHLGHQPQLVSSLVSMMKLECPCLSFGDLRPPLLVGSHHEVQLRTQRLWEEEAVPKMKSNWTEFVGSETLLSLRLHSLAMEELESFQLENDGEDSCERLARQAITAAAEAYKSLRAKAAEVVQLYFLEPKPVLELFCCGTLDEVLEILRSPLESSSSSSGSTQPPCRPWRSVPVEVLRKIEALTWVSRASDTEALHKVLVALGGMFKAATLAAAQEVNPKKGKEYAFVSEGVVRISEKDADDLAEAFADDLKKEFQGLNISGEDSKKFLNTVRVYLTRGSLWLLFVSEVELNVERLLSIIDNFIQERRARSFSWAFAQSPRQVPPFAAPGLYQLARMVEALRDKLDVPRVVQLKGFFFKGLALKLEQQRGADLEDWQVHVVSNGRDVQDNDWLSVDRNPDLHFVTSSNWRSLEWPDPEVFAKLEELNQQSRSTTQIFNAAACLANEMLKPDVFGVSASTMMQLLQGTEADALLKDLLKMCLSRPPLVTQSQRADFQVSSAAMRFGEVPATLALEQPVRMTCSPDSEQYDQADLRELAVDGLKIAAPALAEMRSAGRSLQQEGPYALNTKLEVVIKRVPSARLEDPYALEEHGWRESLDTLRSLKDCKAKDQILEWMGKYAGTVLESLSGEMTADNTVEFGIFVKKLVATVQPMVPTRGSRGDESEEMMEEMLQYLMTLWDPSGTAKGPMPAELLRGFCEEFD